MSPIIQTKEWRKAKNQYEDENLTPQTVILSDSVLVNKSKQDITNIEEGD